MVGNFTLPDMLEHRMSHQRPLAKGCAVNVEQGAPEDALLPISY